MPDGSRAPLHLLIACGRAAPGAATLLERAVGAAKEGRPVRVILTGDGLGWAGDARIQGFSVSLCSRSARDRGLGPEAGAGAAWSSLVAWSRDVPEDALVWAALP